MKSIGILLLLALVEFSDHPVAAQQTLEVDCTAASGLNTLAAALEMANPGDTINVTGPCPNTAVSITIDDLTLVGVENPVLIGEGPPRDVIDVNGARRVIIENFTLRGGDDGVQVRRGATADLNNIVAEGNADDGFTVVANAFARIRNSTAQDNGDDGFAVSFTSNAILSGDTTSTGNANDGFSVVFGSSAEFVAGTFTMTNNGQSATFGSAMFEELIIGDGIRITDSSILFVFASTVIITGNANDGIAVGSLVEFFGFCFC